MKKRIALKFYFGFFLLISHYCQAQIPGIVKQPKWVFTIYGKDATGKLDTVYLGFDDYANQCCFVDSNFGERYIAQPLDFMFATHLNGAGLIKRNEILDSSYFTLGGFELYFSNVTLPITLTWDILQLNNDSLPFANNGFAPIAQLDISWNDIQCRPAFENSANSWCNYSDPILVSDSITSAGCYRTDSIIFENAFGNSNPKTYFLWFKFIQWTGKQSGVGLNEFSKIKTQVYPNPTTGVLFFDLERYEDIDLKARNITGEVMLQTKIKPNSSLDMTHLKPGIYFIELKKSDLSQRVKIIKL